MSGPTKRIDNQHNCNIAISNKQVFSGTMVREALAPFGVEATSALAAAINQYTELLLRWNQKISLTSITDPREILERHFGESMFAAGAVPLARGKLIDVGTGAGFPGLALKLVSPELDMTLIEASQKKAAFLAEVVRALRLANVQIISKRAEELPKLAAADFITCRAVRVDKRLLAWMRGALCANGRCVLWLGAEDAKALQKNSEWSWNSAIQIPNSEKRVLLLGRPVEN